MTSSSRKGYARVGLCKYCGNFGAVFELRIDRLEPRPVYSPFVDKPRLQEILLWAGVCALFLFGVLVLWGPAIRDVIGGDDVGEETFRTAPVSSTAPQ